jgi:hypothetical protein
MKPGRVELQIDELVLEGIDPRDRGLVIAALEQELARRLTRGERPQGSQDAVVSEPAAGPSPAELGVHAARAITGGGSHD